MSPFHFILPVMTSCHPSFFLKLLQNLSIFSTIFHSFFPPVLSPLGNQNTFSETPVKSSSVFDHLFSIYLITSGSNENTRTLWERKETNSSYFLFVFSFSVGRNDLGEISIEREHTQKYRNRMRNGRILPFNHSHFPLHHISLHFLQNFTSSSTSRDFYIPFPSLSIPF